MNFIEFLYIIHNCVFIATFPEICLLLKLLFVCIVFNFSIMNTEQTIKQQFEQFNHEF